MIDEQVDTVAEVRTTAAEDQMHDTLSQEAMAKLAGGVDAAVAAHAQNAPSWGKPFVVLVVVVIAVAALAISKYRKLVKSHLL